MKNRAAIYLGVYAVVAVAACAFTWSAHAPLPTTVAVETRPATRVERKREVRSISAERQEALGRSLSKGTDWKKLAEKNIFGTEKTQAITRALETGDHAAALALVMQEKNENTRAEGLRAVFKSWALADPGAALEALGKVEDPPPHGNRVQYAAAQGYFYGLNAGTPGTLEAHLPEALRKIPYDQAVQGFFDLACEHLLTTGRVDGARLLDWWKDATASRPDMKFGDGVVSLAKAGVRMTTLEEKGELQPGERAAIHAGLFRAVEALPGDNPSAAGVADWLIHMTGGMEDRHTSIDAYETPKKVATLEIYMKGAGLRFAKDPPGIVLPLLATATDDAGRAKADGLWAGYAGSRARTKSTSDAMAEFSAPGIPIAQQQQAARAIVERKMGEDSILLTTLVNDLPENPVKDAYRARIADWLQRNGHKKDAAMWRDSVKDKGVLEK